MAERRYATADFAYHLPDELIAQVPAPRREESRLLVVDRRSGTLADRRFPDLVAMPEPGDVLVLNTTRVRHARFLGTRPNGATAEVLLLHPTGNGEWLALGKPGRALQPGKRVVLADDVAIETVAVTEDGFRRVRFIGTDVDDAMARFGRLPLPPYITRDPVGADEERYQTVYAEREGSVAAPTAGLHFSREILDALAARGIDIARIDLEVGPGTFKPVEVEDPREHPMHAERFEIPEAAASQVAEARRRGGAVWAVGTTVVRALESAARDDGTVAPGRRDTALLITPGFRFRVVDRLLTNFHLPRSTLLMLVSAFGGFDLVRAAYAHAVAERYRFYSYGDAMCIR
jgi:S-adenosylmethionine:tRNA ribosyltransferase-isomerase